MVTVVRPWRGVSAGDRRDGRRQRLIEACLDVVAEVGVAAVTVNAVCAAAGLSKRYFYESFDDREALLVAALDRVVTGTTDRMREGLAQRSGDVLAISDFALRVLLETITEDRRLAQLFRQAPADPALHRRRDQGVTGFTKLLLSHVPGADPDDPRWQAAGLVLVSGVTDLVGRWLNGSPAVDPETLVPDVAALAAAGLTATSRRRAGGARPPIPTRPAD